VWPRNAEEVEMKVGYVRPDYGRVDALRRPLRWSAWLSWAALLGHHDVEAGIRLVCERGQLLEKARVALGLNALRLVPAEQAEQSGLRQGDGEVGGLRALGVPPV
jgi:hypothetical protein